MDDDFLHVLHEEPSAGLAAGVRARLSGPSPAAPTRPARLLVQSLKMAAAAVIVAAVLALPSVRASAQSFLALFRVGTFVGVPVDTQRAAELSRELDLEALLGNRVHVVQPSGPPQEVSTIGDASAAAGFDVRVPQAAGLTLMRLAVRGSSHVDVTGDTAALRLIMDALAIDDLEVPAGLDGQVMTVRVSPVVVATFTLEGQGAASGSGVELVQAIAPEVTLGSGVDVAALGEIALRIFGVAPDDAREIASHVDWNTTLLVPLPPGATAFDQVPVRGGDGLLVRMGPEDYPSYTLLWSADGRAYGMKVRGGATAEQVLEVANSIP